MPQKVDKKPTFILPLPQEVFVAGPDCSERVAIIVSQGWVAIVEDISWPQVEALALMLPKRVCYWEDGQRRFAAVIPEPRTLT